MKWEKQAKTSNSKYDIDFIIGSLLKEDKNDLVERIIDKMSEKELQSPYEELKEIM